MQIYVSGSLAYDRIMTFGGRFADHILPDKIHMLNVCFNVDGLQEWLGGTAGNIAFGLSQLGETPVVLGCLGRDGDRYLDWLRTNGIETGRVRVVPEQYTAGAFITTDQARNQITGFNPGAMLCSCQFDCAELDPADSLVIISPGNFEDMTGLPRALRQRRTPFIYDPGQSLNILEGPVLREAIQDAMVLISNDYELEVISRKTGLDLEGLLGVVGAVITTKGEQGSQVVERGGRTAQIPVTPPSQVVDPTGAGDAYRAGLLKGLALGLDLPRACVWGATLASYAVACHGTQEYSLDQAEFQTRLETTMAEFQRRNPEVAA
ncbi:MAG: carbohydrate kinase family protein [Desulfarculus sp.]|nr:carbohydrate kinase family protein [Desulfarculus sp.]